jgi:heme exporter protein D
MHWNTLSDFFAMGGYAFYVWSSFGLTLLVVVWEVVALKQRCIDAIRGIKQASLMEPDGLEQVQ